MPQNENKDQRGRFRNRLKLRPTSVPSRFSYKSGKKIGNYMNDMDHDYCAKPTTLNLIQDTEKKDGKYENICLQ